MCYRIITVLSIIWCQHICMGIDAISRNLDSDHQLSPINNYKNSGIHTLLIAESIGLLHNEVIYKLIKRMEKRIPRDTHEVMEALASELVEHICMSEITGYETDDEYYKCMAEVYKETLSGRDFLENVDESGGSIRHLESNIPSNFDEHSRRAIQNSMNIIGLMKENKLNKEEVLRGLRFELDTLRTKNSADISDENHQMAGIATVSVAIESLKLWDGVLNDPNHVWHKIPAGQYTYNTQTHEHGRRRRSSHFNHQRQLQVNNPLARLIDADMLGASHGSLREISSGEANPFRILFNSFVSGVVSSIIAFIKRILIRGDVCEDEDDDEDESNEDPDVIIQPIPSSEAPPLNEAIPSFNDLLNLPIDEIINTLSTEYATLEDLQNADETIRNDDDDDTVIVIVHQVSEEIDENKKPAITVESPQVQDEAPEIVEDMKDDDADDDTVIVIVHQVSEEIDESRKPAIAVESPQVQDEAPEIDINVKDDDDDDVVVVIMHQEVSQKYDEVLGSVKIETPPKVQNVPLDTSLNNDDYVDHFDDDYHNDDYYNAESQPFQEIWGSGESAPENSMVFEIVSSNGESLISGAQNKKGDRNSVP